jgi:hypothetical protein
LFFTYYSIANNVFSVLGCTVYDEGNHSWFLNYAPWVQCSPASQEYEDMLSLSIPVLILFLVGFPIYIWKKIRVKSGKISSKSVARYGFLYLPYKEVSSFNVFMSRDKFNKKSCLVGI